MFNTLLQFRSSWLYDIPRTIFAWIDGGVYWLIARLYELIEDLAYIRVFDDAALSEFYGKVYGLLSIVMLFKVTFSVVSFILDPSKMSDGKQGFGKIIANVMVMFVMLISCPVAFNMLYKAQDAILSDDVIPKFIFGDDGLSSEDGQYYIILSDSKKCVKWSKYIKNFDFDYNDEVKPWKASNKGDYIAMMVFRPFYGLGNPDDAKAEGYELEKVSSGYTVANWCSSENSKGYDIDINNSTVDKMLEYTNYYHAARRTSNDYYLMEYRFFLSTAIGVFVALMFLSIAFDIAVRAIQLSFLQLIAPIPIISYIDPASSKNGTFSKWIKNVGKTWASLFIRLFAIFLAIYVISKIDTDMITNSFKDTGKTPSSSEFFIMLFIVIGALMFAKKLPQLIEELIPGIKMGKMQLNPLKKIEEEAIGGKQIAGTVRGVGGAARGIVGGSIAGIKAGTEAGSPVKGFLLGAGQGLVGGFKTPKGAFSNSMNQTYKTLTGNELARLSLSKMIAHAGSEKKMNEVKDTLKNLNEEKRNLSQKLSVQEHTTGAVASSLQASGVNLSDLPNEKNRLQNEKTNQMVARFKEQNSKNAELANMAGYENQKRQQEALKAAAEAKLNAVQAAYEQARNDKDAASLFMANFKGPKKDKIYQKNMKIVKDFKQEEAKFKADISKHSNDINVAQQAIVQAEVSIDNSQKKIDQYDDNINSINEYITKIDDNIKNIDIYTNAYDEAVKTRSELSQVEKDITTMQNEKTQRARFNQVEEKSPKENVKKIIKKYNNNNGSGNTP